MISLWVQDADVRRPLREEIRASNGFASSLPVIFRGCSAAEAGGDAGDDRRCFRGRSSVCLVGCDSSSSWRIRLMEEVVSDECI